MRGHVYWNITRKRWSIMHKGLVIDHKPYLWLLNVEYKVRPAGRAKVLRTKTKNVHAFCVGDLPVWVVPLLTDAGRVRYNPYRDEQFNIDGREIKGSRQVWLDHRGKAHAKGTVEWQSNEETHAKSN